MSALNILLVEDHDEWLKILYERVKNAVEKMGLQPNITIAKTFDVAWKKLETKEFWHLLITDIGLGGAKVSHQKLGKQLVERARNQEMPCIVVSGTPQITPGDVSILYEKLGVSHFFWKDDFDGEEFIKTVIEVLGRDKMELQPEVINNATLFLFDIGRWAASELKERWKVSRQKSGKTTGQVDITNQDDQAKQQMVVLLNDLTKELGASKLEPVFNLIKQKSDMIVEWREMKIDHEKEYNRQMITRAALRLRQQELNKKILQTMAEIEAELSKIDVKVKKEDINLGS